MRGFDFGTLMDALALSLDPRKALVMVVGLVATWLPALLFFSLAGSSAGGAIATLLGLLVLWIGFSLTFGTVTKIISDQLVFARAVHWRAAAGYAVAHLDGFLFGPLVVGVGLLLLLVVEVIVLFLGRIPYLGELLVAVLFIPLLAINVFALIVAVFGNWLLFPVVATDGLGAMSAPLRVVAIVRQNPVRIVGFGVVGVALAGLAMTILLALLLASLSFTLTISGIGLGPEKTAEIMGLGPLAGLLLGGFSGGFFALQPPPLTIVVARLIFTVGLAAFTALLYAYPLVFLLAIASSMYVEARRSMTSGAGPDPSLPAQPEV